MDDVRDMYSMDVTATFRERTRLKGKKLYINYSMEETMAISSEDEDNMELAKQLRSDPLCPQRHGEGETKILIVQEANKKMLRDEEHCVHL